MTQERKSLIAGVGVLIFTVILAGVAVTAHNTSEPEPEWLMVMNAETVSSSQQETPTRSPSGVWMGRCWRSRTGSSASPNLGHQRVLGQLGERVRW